LLDLKILSFKINQEQACRLLVEDLFQNSFVEIKKNLQNLLMKKTFLIHSLLSIILLSCSKKDSDASTSGSNANNTSNNITGTGNTGSLILNISWAKPQPILACPITSFIDVEIKGTTSNFNQTYVQASPIRIDKRLAVGTYTYTIKKRPNTNCFKFTTIVESGSLKVNSCPTICGNATILSFKMD